MKKILFVFICLLPLYATSQVMMTSYYSAASSSPAYSGLLDQYPNAAGAYSFRLLKSDYAGSCIKVRRSSDNSETDIGFSGNVLDTATLKTFVGAGNGFVTTWYDQSGNAKNATQSTALEQPVIINSGVVNRQGGHIMLDFLGQRNLGTAITVNKPFSIIAIFSQIYKTSSRRMINSNTNNCLISATRNDGICVYTGGVIRNTAYAAAYEVVLGSLIAGSSVTNFYYDGTDITTGTGNNNFGLLWFGASPSWPEPADGLMDELIVYLSDKSADRTGIESNINTYYTIW